MADVIWFIVGAAGTGAIRYVVWIREVDDAVATLGDLYWRWRRLGLKTRRQLAHAMKNGDPVPVEYAAIVIEMMDNVPHPQANLNRKLAQACAPLLVVFGVTLFFAVKPHHHSFAFLPLGLSATAIVDVARRWRKYRALRTPPANLARTRAAAEQALDTHEET